jgi:hypothetical protein
MDASDPLNEEPFSYLSRSDGSVVIRYRSAPVTLLRGKAAARFATRMADAEPAAAQQLMARATGNVKRTNKRRGQLAHDPLEGTQRLGTKALHAPISGIAEEGGGQEGGDDPRSELGQPIDRSVGVQERLPGRSDE